jgi:hypothetical protein
MGSRSAIAGCQNKGIETCPSGKASLPFLASERVIFPFCLFGTHDGAAILTIEKGRTMGLFGNTKRTLVVDLAAVLKAKGTRGHAAPRQQLQILRSLSRLVQREKMNVTAVIVGKPLNKAPHNKKFDGVRVRYAKVDEKLDSQLCASMSQAGSAGVLVTENIGLEKKMIRSGKETLRVSTFRKLIEDGVEPQNAPNNGARSNRGRRERNPQRSERNNDRPERNNDRPKMDKKAQQQDEISQMIDLVD